MLIADGPTMPEDDQDLQSLARAPRPSFLRELFELMAEHKKWWLVPIVLAVLLLGALAVLGGSAAAPFIYPLF